MEEVTPQLRAERILDGAVNTSIWGFGLFGSLILALCALAYNSGFLFASVFVNCFFWTVMGVKLHHYIHTIKSDLKRAHAIAYNLCAVCIAFLAVSTAWCISTYYAGFFSTWMGLAPAASCACMIFWANIQHLLREAIPKEVPVECHQ